MAFKNRVKSVQTASYNGTFSYFNLGKNCAFLKLCHQTKALHTVLSRKKLHQLWFLTVHAVAVKKSIQRMNAFFFRDTCQLWWIIFTTTRNYNSLSVIFHCHASLKQLRNAQCFIIIYFVQFLTFLLKLLKYHMASPKTKNWSWIFTNSYKFINLNQIWGLILTKF